MKGTIVGFKRKGDSGLPEITISLLSAPDGLVIPLFKDIKIKVVK